LALGTERPEPNVMQRPPRRRDQSLLDSQLVARALWLGGIETALCYAGFFWVNRQFGYTDFLHLPHPDWQPFADRLATEAGRVYVLASTVFHAGVVAAQIGNAFACRTEKELVRRMGLFTNRFLLLGIGVEALLILLMIYLPPLAWVFEHRPLPLTWWAGLLLYAPALYLLEWIRKYILRVKERVRGHPVSTQA